MAENLDYLINGVLEKLSSEYGVSNIVGEYFVPKNDSVKDGVIIFDWNSIKVRKSLWWTHPWMFSPASNKESFLTFLYSTEKRQYVENEDRINNLLSALKSEQDKEIFCQNLNDLNNASINWRNGIKIQTEFSKPKAKSDLNLSEVNPHKLQTKIIDNIVAYRKTGRAMIWLDIRLEQRNLFGVSNRLDTIVKFIGHTIWFYTYLNNADTIEQQVVKSSLIHGSETQGDTKTKRAKELADEYSGGRIVLKEEITLNVKSRLRHEGYDEIDDLELDRIITQKLEKEGYKPK